MSRIGIGPASLCCVLPLFSQRRREVDHRRRPFLLFQIGPQRIRWRFESFYGELTSVMKRYANIITRNKINTFLEPRNQAKASAVEVMWVSNGDRVNPSLVLMFMGVGGVLPPPPWRPQIIKSGLLHRIDHTELSRPVPDDPYQRTASARHRDLLHNLLKKMGLAKCCFHHCYIDLAIRGNTSIWDGMSSKRRTCRREEGAPPLQEDLPPLGRF